MNHQKKKDKDKSEDNEEIEEESDTEEKGEKEDIEVPFYPMIFNVSWQDNSVKLLINRIIFHLKVKIYNWLFILRILEL